MVVQHNMQALNANRMLGVTSGLQAKSTEKLASGYQINRAADDAAGLSISEKMRKQIKGLDQASTNAQDGISAVQTAEGALTEVHSMLQRMNELAVQAANGTNSETDRQSIQDEIDQLTTEIDRVAETTKFNETYLLKGNGKATTVKIDAKDAGIEGALTGVGTGNATFKMDELKTGEQITIGSKGYTIGSSIETVQGAIEKANTGDKVTINGTAYTIAENAASVDTTENIIEKAEIKKLVSDGDKVVVGSNSYVAMTDGTSDATYVSADELTDLFAELGEADKVKVGDVEYTVDIDDTTGVVPEDVEESLTGTADSIANLLKVGDKYTIKADDAAGTQVTIIADTATPAGATEKKLADAINDVKTNSAGTDPAKADTVVINRDGGDKTFTVGTGTAAFAATADHTGKADDIKALVTEGTTVEIDGKKYILGDKPDDFVDPDGVGDNDASVITAEKAYELIAKELASAGSIGTDPGSEAKITMQKVDENGALAEDGEDALFSIANGKVTFEIEEGEVDTKQGLQFTLHVGADADENNKIALTIDAMDSTSLGVSGINVVDNTGAKATYAIDSIADAVAKVSAQRSALGAVQNRLEHTIANLDNVVENTTAAESAIRDTDMAAEMVNYSKNNILAQAGQAMLAQANTSTQGVLSLLG